MIVLYKPSVFQTKVLQKLYPAAPKKEDPRPTCNVEALAKKTCTKRKASQVNSTTEDAQSAANPGRRLYTVTSPPADYKIGSEKSVTLPLLESINSAKDPADEIAHESDEELDKDEEGKGQHRKKRRRKRKPALLLDSGTDGAVSESFRGQSQTLVEEGGESISWNRKRKLKKKRHKEKLRSMGLMPRASALEFTYRKDEEEEEEEEEEDIERRAAEVADFFRTTMEIYMSDSSSRVDKLPLLSTTMDDLLCSIASGDKPTSVLQHLYSLKVFVQKKETDKLEASLENLQNSSLLSAEETTAVVSLFQYWITDILSMQGDRKTGLSTMHP
ncbi:uncharacterized protein LOC132993380 isoform X1 [Labrus mixtus]|uniref:uncharacterized protein LOC132993380 isoform X1 n=1 Tax=Labrus mixtus TaxID=508554 RepID=UPI0029C064FC|nr:uncharacterized protein LOC132993380 isoform X1 [Labrus mixtus]